MVWTHIWNKAGQSRIILRKLHTFRVLQHMSSLFGGLSAFQLSVQINAAGKLQDCSCERSRMSPCRCHVLHFIRNSGFSPECQLNRKRGKLRELSIQDRQLTMNNKEEKKNQIQSQPVFLQTITQSCNGRLHEVTVHFRRKTFAWLDCSVDVLWKKVEARTSLSLNKMKLIIWTVSELPEKNKLDMQNSVTKIFVKMQNSIKMFF